MNTTDLIVVALVVAAAQDVLVQLVVCMMVAVVARMIVDCDLYLAESLPLLWLHMLHSMR